jgi:hypothetical protein
MTTNVARNASVGNSLLNQSISYTIYLTENAMISACMICVLFRVAE